MDATEPDPEVNLVWVGMIVEGGLVVVALVLAYFGLYDHPQPLRQIDWSTCQQAIVWGTVATIPMLVYLVVFHFWTPRFLQPMQEFVVENLYPVFRGSTIFEMLLLSLMAGFCEELLFRWCLQGGIASLLESRAGQPVSLAIGLLVASILFGLCHWVNTSYGMTTLFVGMFLGLTMIWSGSFLVPAMAHAIFDFVALIYISRLTPEVSSE